MPRIEAGLKTIALLTLLAPFPIAAAPADDDRAAVLGVAEAALAAVSRKDFAAVADLMIEEGSLVSARQQDGVIRHKAQARAQIRETKVEGTLMGRGNELRSLSDRARGGALLRGRLFSSTSPD